ncbi:MAG TPA: hypothetical protein DCS19_01705 [Flavobacterium sp.]|nr:hypothetical protein [Flavobacterium sp.]
MELVSKEYMDGTTVFASEVGTFMVTMIEHPALKDLSLCKNAFCPYNDRNTGHCRFAELEGQAKGYILIDCNIRSK